LVSKCAKFFKKPIIRNHERIVQHLIVEIQRIVDSVCAVVQNADMQSIIMLSECLMSLVSLTSIDFFSLSIATQHKTTQATNTGLSFLFRMQSRAKCLHRSDKITSPEGWSTFLSRLCTFSGPTCLQGRLVRWAYIS